MLDPVITVHPDEVFFGASRRTSRATASSPRARCSEHRLVRVRHHEHRLLGRPLREFQKIRSYKTTRFEVDPTGFEVRTTNEGTFRRGEDRPPGQLGAGFLQVSSAMSLPATTFDLHPMDARHVSRPPPSSRAARAALDALPPRAREARPASCSIPGVSSSFANAPRTPDRSRRSASGVAAIHPRAPHPPSRGASRSISSAGHALVLGRRSRDDVLHARSVGLERERLERVRAISTSSRRAWTSMTRRS